MIVIKRSAKRNRRQPFVYHTAPSGPAQVRWLGLVVFNTDFVIGLKK